VSLLFCIYKNILLGLFVVEKISNYDLIRETIFQCKIKKVTSNRDISLKAALYTTSFTCEIKAQTWQMAKFEIENISVEKNESKLVQEKEKY